MSETTETEVAEPVEEVVSEVTVTESSSGDHLEVAFPSAPAEDINWVSTDDSVVAISSTLPDGTLASLRYGRPGVVSIIATSKSADGKHQRAMFTVYVQRDEATEVGTITHVVDQGNAPADAEPRLTKPPTGDELAQQGLDSPETSQQPPRRPVPPPAQV